MADDSKICLICGINTNKKARYERYNLPPIQKTKQVKGKTRAVQQDTESDSDSDEGSKRKRRSTPQRSLKVVTPTTSSRQTRNQNPKAFAASMCKVLDLPPTPDHPFLSIFSVADYCQDCLGKIKEVHSSQLELEKIQAKISEARVDIELDLSKHLQKIPFCKNVLRTDAYERYKHDITMILDFHDPEKKTKVDADEDTTQEKPSAVALKKLKRKAEANGAGSKRNDRVKIKKEADDAVVVDMNEVNDDGLIENGDVSKNNEVQKEPELTADMNVKMEIEAEDVKPVIPPEVAAPPPEPVKLAAPVKVKTKRDPSLKCPHCAIPRYFNIPQSLEDHVNKVHNRPFACDACERKFHTEKELLRHKESIHDGEVSSLYICGFCDQEFKQKRYLEDHLDQHPQSKPLNCQFCGRGFKRAESLQKGFQIYKGEPVEPCRHCGRNLNLKDYLEHNKSVK